MTRMKDKELTVLRRNSVGFIFQAFNLIPQLSAEENIVLPLSLGGQKANGNLETLLDQVGLADRRKHKPTELSGGQQQRVAIARALVSEPALVLADEPTANLDSATGREIVDLMRRLNRERGTTFVFSTHDPRIMSAADRVVEISDGRLR